MSRALAWVVAYIDEFDPFKNGRAFDVAHGQRVTELATMLNSYVGLTGDRESENVRALLAEARRQQQNRALTDRIMHSPAEFVLFADLYAALKRLGHDDLHQREIIQRVIDAGYLDQVERVPHRMMDVRLTLEWGDFRHDWESLEALSRSSILPREPSALHLDESSLYSLTHVIMFLYGFGTRMGAASPLSDEQHARFAETLSMLLVVSAQEHHWDLLCELLLCWDCLRLAPTRIYRKAWDAFLEQQLPDGAFPGPERALASSNPAREADPSKRRELYFAHHYHTTLVAVIATAVHSSRDDLLLPPPRVAGAVPLVAHAASRTRRTTVFRRAQGWLSSQLDSVADESSDGDLRTDRACLEILVGAFVCGEALGEAGFVRDAASRVSCELNRSGNRAELRTIPPALAITGAAILQREQHPNAGLDALLATFAGVLARNLSTDALSDLEWSEKRVLLHQLGLHEEPARLSRDKLLAFADTVSPSSEYSLIDQLAIRVDSATACGTARVDLRPEDWWLPELLIGFANHRFRQHEYRRATRLLRTASALTGPNHPMLTQCRDFLLLHQDIEGTFGFFSPAQDDVVRHAAPGFSFDRDVRLPVTLDCLWALAECGGDDWRLFQSLPRVETSESIGTF